MCIFWFCRYVIAYVLICLFMFFDLHIRLCLDTWCLSLRQVDLLLCAFHFARRECKKPHVVNYHIDARIKSKSSGRESCALNS